jgi:hypothetical protein
MDPLALISNLAARGVTLIPDGDGLIARPRELITDADREAIRQRKADLMAYLGGGTGLRYGHTMTPDSRCPLIEPAIRTKLEAIEPEARAKGWPAELLWNSNFWDHPRGLAAVLDPDDEIVEVSAECITILKIKRDVLRFRRHVG